MRKIRRHLGAIACLASVLALVCPPLAHAQRVRTYVSGDRLPALPLSGPHDVLGPVTGSEGYYDVLRVVIGTDVTLPHEAKFYGVTAIAIQEKGDEPCRIELYGRLLDPDGLPGRPAGRQGDAVRLRRGAQLQLARGDAGGAAAQLRPQRQGLLPEVSLQPPEDQGPDGVVGRGLRRRPDRPAAGAPVLRPEDAPLLRATQLRRVGGGVDVPHRPDRHRDDGVPLRRGQESTPCAVRHPTLVPEREVR